MVQKVSSASFCRSLPNYGVSNGNPLQPYICVNIACVTLYVVYICHGGYILGTIRFFFFKKPINEKDAVFYKLVFLLNSLCSYGVSDT